MVSAPEVSVPAAIVLNGSEQPSHAASNGSGAGNASYTNGNSNGNGAGSLSPSASPAGLGIDSSNGSHSRLESRRASFQRCVEIVEED